MSHGSLRGEISLLLASHTDGARCGSTNDFKLIRAREFIYMSYTDEACERAGCQNAFFA